MEGDAGSGTTRPGPSPSPGSNALMLALNEMCDSERWYTSTTELQLASLEFCIACRKYQTLRLRVDEKTPRTLLAAVEASATHPKRLCRARVPRLRARRVTWNMPTAVELRTPVFALKDADCLDFGPAFVGSLEDVVWPRRLKIIEFDWYSSFDQPIDGVQWPASLQKLDFGYDFNQPIEDVILPNSLQYLRMGDDFDHPIEDVRWPQSLQQMRFGKCFNQPIEEVVWPSSLRELSFGYRSRFDQPIEDVEWPASLRQLTLSEEFDQPIEWCTFPALLEELEFGLCFNQPVEGVTWPGSLQRLAFGYLFNQPVDLVRWPASLEDVCFGKFEYQGFDNALMFSKFDQRVDVCAWPASLRRLTLGHKFRQSLQGLGTWMPNLETLNLLDFGSGTEDSLLCAIEWPKDLRQLAVFRESSLDGVVIPSTVELSRPCNDTGI